MILVDTPIWSLGLRRNRSDLNPSERTVVKELERLVRTRTARLIGPIRQEVLSGIRDERTFQKIQEALAPFGVLGIEVEDYDRAAQFFNSLQRKGIVGTDIDLLICAVASRLEYPIFTLDQDFKRFARHLDISLYKLSWRRG